MWPTVFFLRLRRSFLARLPLLLPSLQIRLSNNTSSLVPLEVQLRSLVNRASSKNPDADGAEVQRLLASGSFLNRWYLTGQEGPP
jgi:hypothetical protein